MIPKFFTDGQLAELERMAAYQKFQGLCPTCRGAGVYLWKGVEHHCEVDDFGHVQERLLRLYLLNGVPNEHMRLAWEDFPFPKISGEIGRYVDTFSKQLIQGMGYDLYGPLGVGKTWAASRIHREVCKMGHSTYHIDFQRLKSLFETGTQESRDAIKRRMLNSVLLVVDDIIPPPPASEKARRLFESKLEEVIRARAHDALPTITTTNMGEGEFAEHYPRVASVLSGKQYRIDFDGATDGRTKAFEQREQNILNEETAPIE